MILLTGFEQIYAVKLFEVVNVDFNLSQEAKQVPMLLLLLKKGAHYHYLSEGSLEH